jgi:hypothetical protein
MVRVEKGNKRFRFREPCSTRVRRSVYAISKPRNGRSTLRGDENLASQSERAMALSGFRNPAEAMQVAKRNVLQAWEQKKKLSSWSSNS